MSHAVPVSQRLLSLDTVRGLTLMAMIFVNNPGNWEHVWWPFDHAEWNGFTPTDFIFPNFLFVVGVSIVFALSRKKEMNQGFGSIMKSAVIRGAILCLIGMFICLFVINWDFSHLRIPGVLQRIGVVFVICSALYLKLGNRAMAITAFTLLAIYYVLMHFVPIPGVGHPDLLAKDVNLGAWLDRVIFTPDHLYRFTKTWDPEGLLTTVPSVATGLFGVLTGVTLKSVEPAGSKLMKLFGVGAVLAVAGLLCNFIFPINKNLWTSSFVLFTSGLSMLFLGAAYWLIDVKGWKRWTAWPVVFGVNSIFAYFFSEMFPTVLRKLPAGEGKSVFDRIWEGVFLPLFSEPKLGSHAQALALVLFMTPILWFMHRRKWILKV